ncbi:hypothetical protein Vretifemale_5962 [Volvox reticuliferus]|uniref:Rab-GAP TBC domain-containing protein n=2 Tax=Volvox reticuliferus TaxID=1737510 RepID=A0A8J4FKW2_9CHLO|nr:hypothetical protein Vretifemale_5962 [Volvox reticuliferus]
MNFTQNFWPLKRNAVQPKDTRAINKARDASWQSVRSKGLSPALRAHLWPHFLDVSTHGGCPLSELVAVANDHVSAQAFYAAKGGTESWQETASRIARDAERIRDETDTLRGDQRADGIARVKRVLIAYALHDCAVGYCQGMADLAVPFLELYPTDDEMAFTVFRAFMARVRENFLPGMLGIQRQLQQLGGALGHVDIELHRHLVKIGAGNYIFAFQMLFLHLKRESSLPNLLTLWECMWACEDLLAQEQRRCEPLVCRQQTSPAAAHGVPETLLTPPSAAVAESITEPQQPVALVCVNDGQEREGITGSKQPSAREAAREEDQQQPLAAGTAVEATVVGIPAARVYLCVYVVAAALRRERKALLACGSMEEVLQFVNKFPSLNDVVGLVHDAEHIYKKCEGSARGQQQCGGPALSGLGNLCILANCFRPLLRLSQDMATGPEMTSAARMAVVDILAGRSAQYLAQ